jgi:hypothetical protein
MDNLLEQIQIDQEFRRLWEEEFKTNSHDKSKTLFTKEEQIDRLAKNIAFWDKLKPNVTLDRTKPLDQEQNREMKKLLIIEKNISELMDKAVHFGIRVQVLQRLNELGVVNVLKIYSR